MVKHLGFWSEVKVEVKVKSLSHIRLFVTPWTAAYQAPQSMDIKNYIVFLKNLTPPDSTPSGLKLPSQSS